MLIISRYCSNIHNMSSYTRHISSSLRTFLKDKYAQTDIVLLLFLLLFLNISLVVKLVALAGIYVLRFNFKFGVSFIKPGRIPAFYLSMLALVAVQLLFNFQRGGHYIVLATTVMAFWAASLLAIHQLQLSIEKSGIEKTENALACFFVANAAMSLLNILLIMLETRSINPYMYEGLSYKYHVSTGDYIKGIMFDTSTANMFINALGVFYFLYKKHYLLSFVCMLVALLTTSNLGNLILCVFLLYVLVVDPSRLHKTIMLCYIGALVIFSVKISPANLVYFKGKMKNTFGHDTMAKASPQLAGNKTKEHSKEELMEHYAKILRSRYYDSSQAAAEERNAELSRRIIASSRENNRLTDKAFMENQQATQAHINAFAKAYYGDSVYIEELAHHQKWPGKLVSYVETFHFAGQGFRHALIGAGAGNFSSKLAFKASNIGVYGKYPSRFTYIGDEFRDNHLKLFVHYFTQPVSEHSVLNTPNSVLNQLLGEYGLIGILLFVLHYLWFFVKHYKHLSYGKIILPMCLCFLCIDYWFEHFTLIIIFETMMLIELYRIRNQQTRAQHG